MPPDVPNVESQEEDLLTQLLFDWEESLGAGEPIPISVLCADRPELQESVEREIARLRTLDRFMLASKDDSERETFFGADVSAEANLPLDSSDFEIPGFEILEQLGRGGMGVVYKARQKSLDRLVAIKTMAGSRWANPGFVARMRREAKALSQINDPHVVQVFDVLDTPASISLVLEYIDGGNLSARLKGMPLSPREAAEVALTLANTLVTVHRQGMFHRDIKPANVLIDSRGQLKIADFGLVKDDRSIGLQTVAGEFFGTPSYMAPEQAQGTIGTADARTDVYAVGATLYEMLTGRPPFSGTSTVDILNQVLDRDPVLPRFLVPGIPRDLETICLKCLEKQPGKRFGSAEELADELGRYLKGVPIRSRSIGAFGRLAKWCRRRPAVAGLVSLSVAATLVIAGLMASYYESLRHYNQNLVEAVAKANLMQSIAEENERRAKESLYASDIGRAALAWTQDDTRDLTDILERHRPLAGEVDRRGFEWWYLHRQAHLGKRALFKSTEPLYTAFYTPNPNKLIVTGKDSVVRFLNAETGEILQEIRSGQTEVNGVAFSPDGAELATAGDDGTVRIWNIERGEQRLRIETPFRKAFDLVYAADGSRLYSSGVSPNIHVYETRSGRDVGMLVGHSDIIGTMVLMSDRQTLASISNDATLKFWDLATGTLKKSMKLPEIASTLIDDVSRGIVIVGSSRGIVRTIDVNQDHEIDSLKFIDGVARIALHPQGDLLAIGDDNGGIRLKRLDAKGKFIEDDFQPWSAHHSKVYSLFWSADGTRLLSTGKDGCLMSWARRAAEREEPRRFFVNQNVMDWPVQQISSIVVSNRVPRALLRWNPRSGKSAVRSIGMLEHEFAVSTDGKLLAAVKDARTVQLYAIPEDQDLPIDSRLVAEWNSPNRVSTVEFTPDGKKLVINDQQGDVLGLGQSSHVLVLDVPSLQCLDRVPESSVRRVVISPDGRRMTVAITDNILLWDLDEKRIVWKVPQINVLNLAYSPDGEWIATASTNRAVVIRRALDGEVHNQFSNHRLMTSSMIFTPDSRTLVSGLVDSSVVFTHVATGQELLKVEKIGSVRRFEFADAGKFLVCRVVHDENFPPMDAPDEIVVLNASELDDDDPIRETKPLVTESIQPNSSR